MRYFLLFIFAFFIFNVFSQRNVSGKVFDDTGELLAGATIMEVGTVHGVISNFDGEFQITTSKDISTLRFSFMGMLPKTVVIMRDEVLHVVLEQDTVLLNSILNTRWRSINVGIDYDFVNSLFGLSFNNGYHERGLAWCGCQIPRRHFLYKVNAQTNFEGDYSFGANLMWNRSRLRFFNGSLFIIPSIGFEQYSLSSQDFFHRDIFLSSVVYTRLPIEFTLRASHQTLNDFNNWGGTFGLQRRFRYSFYYGLIGYYGASVGYFNNYWTYSAYIRGRIGWSSFSYQLTYDRINNHDFFNVGLAYWFSWRRR